MQATKEQMTVPVKEKQKTAALWAVLSFVLPAAVVFAILAACGITPFGDATLVTEAGFRWFEHFCRAYESIVSGEGLFYHLNEGFGSGFYAEFAAGQCSPFWLAALCFPWGRMAAAYSVITALRAGLAGLFCFYMLEKCVNGRRPLAFAIACGYALGGFTACAAWYPSIADGAVFFPLMVAGVYVCAAEKKPLRLFLFASLFFITSSRLLVGGIVVCMLLYLAFVLRERNAALSLDAFATFAATLLCAAGSSAVLIIPQAASAIYSKGGLFSRVKGTDLFASLCFGGCGTRAPEGTGYLCMAGLLLIGMAAYLLNNRVSGYERLLVGAAAGMFVLAAAVPTMGSILYGFCAYGDEAVNMAFVPAALAAYATARHFAEPKGSRLLTAGIAAGYFIALCVPSLILRGAGVFAVLADAGLAVVFVALFMVLCYDREQLSLRLSLLTAAALTVFGVLHCGAVIGSIASSYHAGELLADSTERLRISRLVEEREAEQNLSLRFFRRRSEDSAVSDGVNLRFNRAAGLEAYAAKLGIAPDAAYGGGENFTPLTDILFSVGYVTRGGKVYALRDTVTSPAYTISRWRDEALPEGNAFAVQNAVAARRFGVEGLFAAVESSLTERTDSAHSERYRWLFGNESTTVVHYTVTLAEGDSLYLLAENGGYSYAVGDDSRSNWQTGCRNGIYTLAENAAERVVMDVYLSRRDGQEPPAPTFAVMTADARRTLRENAAALGGNYISRRGGTVRFMLTAENDGAMGVTSIPYEYGWHITKNGKTVKPEMVDGGLIGIPLTAGENSVVMTYTPPFFKASLTASALLLALGLYTALRTEHEFTRRRKVAMAFRAMKKEGESVS